MIGPWRRAGVETAVTGRVHSLEDDQMSRRVVVDVLTLGFSVLTLGAAAWLGL